MKKKNFSTYSKYLLSSLFVFHNRFLLNQKSWVIKLVYLMLKCVEYLIKYYSLMTFKPSCLLSSIKLCPNFSNLWESSDCCLNTLTHLCLMDVMCHPDIWQIYPLVDTRLYCYTIMLRHKCFWRFFLKCSAIFFRQEIVNQKLETHPVKSYITKQLLINGMWRKTNL